MKDLAELTRAALELPSEQRLKLARILLDVSDSGPVSCDAAQAWEEEIQARIEAVRSGTAVGRPADQVFVELDAKYPG